MTKSRDKQLLSLTEEEALGLLDLLILSPADLSQHQRAAAEKLSEYCRHLIRTTESSVVYSAGEGHNCISSNTFAKLY